MIIIITTFCNFSDKKTLHCSSYISSFLLKFQSLFKHPEPRPSDKNGVCWQSSWTRNEIKGWWPCRTMPTWSFPFWNRYSGIKGVTCYQPNSQRSPREGIMSYDWIWKFSTNDNDNFENPYLKHIWLLLKSSSMCLPMCMQIIICLKYQIYYSKYLKTMS